MIKESVQVRLRTIRGKLKKLSDAVNNPELEIRRVREPYSKVNQIGNQSLATDYQFLCSFKTNSVSSELDLERYLFDAHAKRMIVSNL